MKKTISISLNRQVFYLDFDAYEKLETYLESIKKHFKKQDSLEVVEDIESRIAEKFNEIIGKSKKSIQISDVTKIIEEMGTVDDITEENVEVEAEPEKVKKKLLRDPETKILAGVAAGIGWYFGIKPIIVRIIFILLFINPPTTWLAIVTYIAAWLLMPEAKSSWEKLEMKGKPTTVNELQIALEDKASKVASTIETSTRNIIQKIFSIFGHLIKFCWIWFCRLTGFFTLIFTILTIMAIMIGMIFVYLYPSMPFFDFTFLKSIGTPWLEIIYVALALVIITPFVFIIDLADSLMKLKWQISTKKIIILLTVWISSLAVFSGIAKINYPKYEVGLTDSLQHLRYINHIDESYSEILKVGDVSEIDISSVKEVIITEGKENEVKIIGYESFVEDISKNYENGKLIIKGESRNWLGNKNNTGYISPVRVEIKTNKINSIKLNDNIDAWYYPVGNNINIDIGSRVGLKIEGILNKVSLKVGQYSVVNMIDSKTAEADISFDGGVVKTQAKIIKVTGNIGSSLIYKGNPEIIKGSQDKTNLQKYVLSEDYSKIIDAVTETSVNIDGYKKKIKDFDWSRELEKQRDYGFYNLYITVRSVENNKIYILWLIEKDGVITQKTFSIIDNWDEVHYLNLVNDKFLRVNGQVHGPELKEETKDFYIDKTKGILQVRDIEALRSE